MDETNTPSGRGKKITVVIFALLLIVAAGIAAKKLTRPAQDPLIKTTSRVPAQSKQDYKITPAAEGQLPQGFPSDFPIEKQAGIENGYNVIASGSSQASIMFESQKTLADNYKLYSAYLKSHGWTLTSSLNEAAIKSLAAKNTEGTQVVITMAQNSISKANQLTITFVFPVAK